MRAVCRASSCASSSSPALQTERRLKEENAAPTWRPLNRGAGSYASSTSSVTALCCRWWTTLLAGSGGAASSGRERPREEVCGGLWRSVVVCGGLYSSL
ncbi:hypothetical protein EYF80_065076 [Liparis tanakae]|uniref:Uncharacterized protein n=1 Tax=Liparis tanakae TaxID=230148 RepID=A0A4Z2E7K6_9TELE|nr:hypothetical protein EYF80_065076 [Liparis tanakae]